MHTPVLLQEVLDGLAIQKGETVVDATLGAGGYTTEFCERVGATGIVIGIDQDADAIGRCSEKLSNQVCALHLIEGNFRNLSNLLREINISEVDKIAYDLGFSSVQLEESGRGFTFQRDEPLLMTLKKNPTASDITARNIVNDWSEESIANVLFGYGGERAARKISRAIVERREEAPIETTGDLIEVIEDVMPRRGKIHSATRTFQALRIAVNDELRALTESLDDAIHLLTSGGRVAVVSFHSLEDKIVKDFFRRSKEEDRGIILTKKVIKPTDKEQKENPRSRSAKLRIFEKK